MNDERTAKKLPEGKTEREREKKRLLRLGGCRIGLENRRFEELEKRSIGQNRSTG
jgi:hypothetical protein